MTPRVLVVDDDRDMCDALQAVLEKEGYLVTAFTSVSGVIDLVGTGISTWSSPIWGWPR